MHAKVKFESRFCAICFLEYLRYNWLYIHTFGIKMCRKTTQPQCNTIELELKILMWHKWTKITLYGALFDFNFINMAGWKYTLLETCYTCTSILISVVSKTPLFNYLFTSINYKYNIIVYNATLLKYTSPLS